MKIENIDVNAAIENTLKNLKQDKSASPSLRAAIELLIVIIKIFLERITKNSKNSSKPPSTDNNREKKSRKKIKKK